MDKPLQQAQISKAIEEAYKRQIEQKETFDFRFDRCYFRSELRRSFIVTRQKECWFYGKIDQLESGEELEISRAQRSLIRKYCMELMER